MIFYRLFIFSIKYYWALDNMTPEKYVKKHLKKPEISNFDWYRLRGEGHNKIIIKLES